MFIVLLAAPVLLVFDSHGDAAGSVPPPDAETGLRAAFDDEAVPYRVEWITPNEHTALPTLFGSVASVAFGEYRFMAAGPPDPAALIALLEDHPEADPPDARAAVDALLHRIRAARDRAGEKEEIE